MSHEQQQENADVACPYPHRCPPSSLRRQALLQKRLAVLPAVALGGWVVNQAGAPVQFDYGFALVRNPYPLTP